MTEFLQLDQEKQRQILGELLFPQIKQYTTETMAPKVTGMLIDLSVLEVSEILELLENQSLLKERCSEATALIQQNEGGNWAISQQFSISNQKPKNKKHWIILLPKISCHIKLFVCECICLRIV